MTKLLKEQLKNLGLSTTGTKQILETRLKDFQDANWKITDDIYYQISENKDHKENLFCYDLDGTLIIPKGNTIFSEDENDWKFKTNVLETLNKQKDEYHFVIFSNQQKKAGRDKILLKINNIIKCLKEKGYLFDVFIATEAHCAKPSDKMWKLFEKLYEKINMEQSIYCGDMAGRETDISDSDLKFAQTIKLLFKTPEELFGEQDEIKLSSTYCIDEKKVDEIKPCKNIEMILMVGLPGSGKSTFIKQYFPKYEIASNDLTKQKNKTINLVKQFLEEKKSVVVDNLNLTKIERKIFLDIAQQNNIPVRIIWINRTMKECEFLNNKRKQRVPTMVIRMYSKKLERPTKDENKMILEIIEIR